jgi:hypothetical protein
MFGRQLKSLGFLHKSYILKGYYLQLSHVYVLEQMQIAVSTEVISSDLKEW